MTMGPTWAEVDPEDLQFSAVPEPLYLNPKMTRCPGCGSGVRLVPGPDGGPTVSVTYHSGAILGEPCVDTFGWPEAARLQEHLCCICLVCGYGWPQGVAPYEAAE